MIEYASNQFEADVYSLTERIRKYISLNGGLARPPFDKIYGVPRGGLPVAVALAERIGLSLTDDPHQDRVLVVDDLVDSGRTRSNYPGKPFACLHVKPHSPRPDFYAREIPNEWIHYFWEGNGTPQTIEENLVRCLEFIGEDPQYQEFKIPFLNLLKKVEGLQ